MTWPLAVALLWSSLAGPLAGVHRDGPQLRAAARMHRVPDMVMEGVAAVESGYQGGNDWRGAAGEIGRMQIMPATARAAHCAEPLQLEVYGRNIACGARILRRCYEQQLSWSLAIRCFNAPTLPDGTVVYLDKVEHEIGRMALRRLDQPTQWPFGRVFR